MSSYFDNSLNSHLVSLLKASIHGISHLIRLIHPLACVWVIAGPARAAAAEAASGIACVIDSIDPIPERYSPASTHAGNSNPAVSLGCGRAAYATSLPNGVTP
jgi:hypothetical protein